MYAVHSINYHRNSDPSEIVDQILATGKLLPLVDRLPVDETGMQPVDVFAGDHYLVFMRIRDSWPNQASAFVFDAEDLIARGAGFRKNDLLMSYWDEAKSVIDELRLRDTMNATERGILQDLMHYVDDRFEPPYMRQYEESSIQSVVRTLQARLGQIAEEGTYYGDEALRLLADANSRSGYSELVWRGALPISLALADSPVFSR